MNLQMNLHAIGTKCATAVVTIHSDGWSIHIMQAVDASSWDAEH